RVQASRLVEHRERYAGLADIVERGGDPEPPHVLVGESDLDRKAHGDARDEQAMLKGTFVIAAHFLKPGREPVLLDAIDDLGGGAQGVRELYRPAAARRREHRGKGDAAIFFSG